MSKLSHYYHPETASNSENITVHHGKQASNTDVPANTITKPRQKLGTLQPAAGRGLTRQEEKRSHMKKITCQSGMLKVFEDPKDPKVTPGVDEEVQTDLTGWECPHCVASSSTPLKERTAEQEAYELMVQDEPTIEFWKVLAEERRSALDDSLKENEQLHLEVQELQEENSRLTELAKDAEYFAEMFTSMVGEDNTTPSEEHTTDT